MSTFDRSRGETPDVEQNMVFKEVAEGKDEDDIVFEEDPVEQRAREVLNAEKQVANARRKTDGSRDGERKVLVAEVLLAKARFDQAAYNEKLRKSKPGEADRLLTKWQETQDRLDAFNKQSIDTAYADAISIAGRSNSELDPDTIAQLRRHAN